MKELVIKLPEDMYNRIMKNVKVVDALTLLRLSETHSVEHGSVSSDCDAITKERAVFIKAIQNGTVLPEKHDGLVLTTDVNHMCSKYATDCGVEYTKMWNEYFGEIHEVIPSTYWHPQKESYEEACRRLLGEEKER